MRTCTDCGADLSARHGNAYLCRPCRNKRAAVRSKAWYNANTEWAAAYHNAWKAAHPERQRELKRRSQDRHRVPRSRAQFTHCQMTDCGAPLEYGRVLWCSRCAPFVKTANKEASRQRAKRLGRVAA